MNSKGFFDSMQHHFNGGLPFVAYRKPNSNEVRLLLQNDDAIHYINDYSESGFVFAPFDNKEKSILIPFNASEVKTLNYEISCAVDSEITNKESATSKVEHIDLVQKGIDAITNKQFKKVVLSRYETIDLSDENPIIIFKRLLDTYLAAFVYCWYHPKVGLWQGATPETLIHVEANRFKTMALAGTQKYNGSLEVNWEDKEKQEQEYVTSFIVDSLKPSVENLSISKPTTIKAGNVVHLKTTISGLLQPNLSAVLLKLHPTPAVCGLPQESAKQFILKEEHYNREFYTGFLGELNIQENRSRNTKRQNVENSAYATVKTSSHLFVNLRCMQLRESKALVYVGGGITKDSIPELEWKETVNKTLTIKAVLD